MTEERLHALRCLAVRLLEWACRGGNIGKDDERYTHVTEGRDSTPAEQKTYSSCGDLAHWMLFQLGVRLPWINRDEHRGFAQQVAVNRLYPSPIGPNPCAHHWDERRLEGGDVVVIGTADDKHLHVVCIVDQGPDYLCTAEYGASGMRVGGIGGHLVTHEHYDGIRLGTRLIRVVLPLEAVLQNAFAVGLLVDPVDIFTGAQS